MTTDLPRLPRKFSLHQEVRHSLVGYGLQALRDGDCVIPYRGVISYDPIAEDRLWGLHSYGGRARPAIELLQRFFWPWGGFQWLVFNHPDAAAMVLTTVAEGRGAVVEAMLVHPTIHDGSDRSEAIDDCLNLALEFLDLVDIFDEHDAWAFLLACFPHFVAGAFEPCDDRITDRRRGAGKSPPSTTRLLSRALILGDLAPPHPLRGAATA